MIGPTSTTHQLFIVAVVVAYGIYDFVRNYQQRRQ